MDTSRLAVNASGHLLFGGCDTVALAHKYGTPAYIMDGNQITANMRECMHAMQTYFEKYRVYYASKAFLCTALCKMAQKEGLCLDVVSAGELYTALHAGFPGDRIALHGNVKTETEIEMAVDNGCALMVDSIAEIADIQAVAQRLQKRARVAVRVTPGVEAHTHAYIQTGISDCKFALGMEDGQAMAAIGEILCMPMLDFCGLHCHIGSQILSDEPFEKAAVNMAHFALQVQKETGVAVRELTMGGGFGIHYAGDEKPLPVLDYIGRIHKGLQSVYGAAGMPLPEVHIEPGRYIVGEAGITLYTAMVEKHVPGVRTFLSVDGGMADNPRVMLYQAQYEAVVANRAKDAPQKTVRLAGRCCESGDVLIDELALPQVHKGDIIAVFSTGAYNYAMASNYNKLPMPPVVLVQDGRDALIVRGQTLEDMVRWDVVPQWLCE